MMACAHMRPHLCKFAYGCWPSQRREKVVVLMHVLHLLESLWVPQHIKELVEPRHLVDATHYVIESLGVIMSTGQHVH